MSSPNEQLLMAIRNRLEKRTEFGLGIGTAGAYVRNVYDCAGSDACYKYATGKDKSKSFDDVMRKAANTLCYRNPEMVLEEIPYSYVKGTAVKTITAKTVNDDNEVIELPPNTLMVLRHVLTTPTKDRDNDMLRTQGATIDPSMLLLWQHVHTLPIGKMLAIAEHTASKLVLISAIIDLGEVAHDAAVMADNGMARFSHGFRALEFEELKEDEGETTSPGGFDVKRFEIMEASVVSVPSNVDAEVEEIMLSLIEGGKLTSGLMKEYGQGLRSARPQRVPVEIDVSVLVNGNKVSDSQQAFLETAQRRVFKQPRQSTLEETINADKHTNDAGAKGDCSCTSKETDGKGKTKTADANASEVKFAGGHHLDGSWEDIEHKLRSKIKPFLTAMAISIGERDFAWLVGTFADHVIAVVEKPESGVIDEFRFFKIDWEMKKGQPEFKGEPEQVDIVTTTEIQERSPSGKAMSPDGVKVGRALSAANIRLLENVRDDIAAVLENDGDGMSRGSKSMLDRSGAKLSQVIEAATASSDETGFDPESVKDAMTLVLTDGTLEQWDRMVAAVHVMRDVEEQKSKTEQYRTLVGAS